MATSIHATQFGRGFSHRTIAEALLFSWLRRSRLSEPGRRRLVVALARAEEELVETHVNNALVVYEAVAEEMSLARALEVYLEAADPGEPQASIIARRVMARLEAGTRRRGGQARNLRVDDDTD
jgi:hypothetical protein